MKLWFLAVVAHAQNWKREENWTLAESRFWFLGRLHVSGHTVFRDCAKDSGKQPVDDGGQPVPYRG